MKTLKARRAWSYALQVLNLKAKRAWSNALQVLKDQANLA